MDSETLVRKALALAPAERAELAHELLLSLDRLSESEVQAAWLDEAERRAQQLDDGTVSPIPADEVRRDAHALLRRATSFTPRREPSIWRPWRSTSAAGPDWAAPI